VEVCVFPGEGFGLYDLVWDEWILEGDSGIFGEWCIWNDGDVGRV